MTASEPLLVCLDTRPSWACPEALFADALEKHVALGNAVKLSEHGVVYPAPEAHEAARFVVFDDETDFTCGYPTLLVALASGLERVALHAWPPPPTF
jgi:hypothetical protein